VLHPRHGKLVESDGVPFLFGQRQPAFTYHLSLPLGQIDSHVLTVNKWADFGDTFAAIRNDDFVSFFCLAEVTAQAVPDFGDTCALHSGTPSWLL